MAACKDVILGSSEGKKSPTFALAFPTFFKRNIPDAWQNKIFLKWFFPDYM